MISISAFTYLPVLGMCVHMCAWLCIYACGGLESTSAVFLDSLASLYWGEISWWTWNLVILAVLAGHLASRFPVFVTGVLITGGFQICLVCPWVLGSKAVWFVCEFWVPNLSLHGLWGKDFIPSHLTRLTLWLLTLQVRLVCMWFFPWWILGTPTSSTTADRMF